MFRNWVDCGVCNVLSWWAVVHSTRRENNCIVIIVVSNGDILCECVYVDMSLAVCICKFNTCSLVGMTTNKYLVGTLEFSIQPWQRICRCYSIISLHGVKNVLLSLYNPCMIALKPFRVPFPPLLFIQGNKKWVAVLWGDKARFSSVWVQLENISMVPLVKEVASQDHDSWKWGHKWFLSLPSSVALLRGTRLCFNTFKLQTVTYLITLRQWKDLVIAVPGVKRWLLALGCFKICFALLQPWHEDATFKIW